MSEETVQPEIPILSRQHRSSPANATVQVVQKAVHTVHTRTRKPMVSFTTDIYDTDKKFGFGPNQPVRRRLQQTGGFVAQSSGIFVLLSVTHNATAEKCFLCAGNRK